MADMIARLKVDSSEYDAKIQRAARGIQDLARACHNAGGVLNVLEDENSEYIQSLGNMATVAQTTRGKIAELTSAFIDIKSVYNSLSDEEKNGEFGRELNRQLDIMKGRIQDGKREIQDISNELNGGGNGLSSALDAVAGKFGLNIGQLTKFGGALALAKGALDTVKGAIESTEATHDALARAISVTDNVTNQFLRSLATADFSNFINGLQSIIDKTIDAYNAMDEFESYAARFQPWQQAKESQIQTKIMQARAAKAKGENDRAEQLNNEAKQLIQELAKSTKVYGEKQTTGGFATIRSLMGQVNISNQQIAWYADPKNWEEAQRKAKTFADTQERITRLRKEANSYKRANETDIGYAMRTGNAAREASRLEDMLRRDQSLRRAYTMQNLRDSDDSKQAQQFRQALGNIYGNTLAENRIDSLMARADRMEGMLTRAGGKGGGGGRTTQKVEDIFPSGSLKDLQQQLQDLQKAQAMVTDPTQWQAYQQAIDGVNEKIAILKGNLPKDSRAEFRFETITDDVMAKLREVEGVHISTKPVTITADTSEAMQQVQQLTSSIENQEVVIRPTVAFAKELPSLPTLVPKIEMPKMPDIKPLKMQIKAELDAQALKADEQTLKTILKDSIQNGINGMDLQFASLNDQIAKGINVPDEKWQAILDQYNKLREAIGKDPISIDFSTGNAKKDEERKGESDFDKGLGDMSKVVSGLNSVASGLQQMGIKLPEGVQKTLGVIQGLTSVIQGVNTIISVFSTSAETANTAAVTGNTVAMTALTAAVVANTSAMGVNTATNFIPFFAHGGLVHAATGYMVPGNDHSDRTLIAASSGELILNRAQQGVIASQLENGNGGGMHVVGEIQGEKIVLVANRFLKRSGQGELVTWK